MRAYNPRPATIIAYTEGDCWHLAWTLHRMTGLPMIFSLYEKWNGLHDAACWDHVGLLLRPDTVLDIFGAQPLDQWKDDWGTLSTIISSDESEIADIVGWTFAEREFDVDSRAVARRLLASVVR